MGIRYEVDFLLHLRDSPLCIKPPGLPPAEEWMGPLPDTSRTQNKIASDRAKNADSSTPDPAPRSKSGIDRNGPRTSATQDPDEVTFGPPRFALGGLSTFPSSRNGSGNSNGNGNLNSRAPDMDKNIARDSDAQTRFNNFRSRVTDGDIRPANNRRKGADEEQEDGGGGWSTVKPRKSFGHEGVERFHGRMGGADRSTGDRKPQRERDEREAPRERAPRNLDSLLRDKDRDRDRDKDSSKDKDGDDESRPRNGPVRGKPDPWSRNEQDSQLSTRERIERAKSWRDRDRTVEGPEDPKLGRPADRRWTRDREPRVEREPEWLDEPLQEKRDGHTEEDFKTFMKNMKAGKSGGPPAERSSNEALAVNVEAEKAKVASAPAMEVGPDKFFLAFGSNAGLEPAATGPADSKDHTMAKTTVKASRFTSFFSHAQEDVRVKTEPPTPAALMQPSDRSGNANDSGNATANGNGNGTPREAPEEERQAFKQLLLKLHSHKIGPSPTPPAGGASVFAEPPPSQQQQQQQQQQHQSQPPQLMGSKSAVTSPEPFQLYPLDQRNDPRLRRPPSHAQEILQPRPMIANQTRNVRSEQLLEEFIGQQQHMQGGPPAPPRGSNVDTSNTDFLMDLLKTAPKSKSTGQLLVDMQPKRQQMPLQEREPDYGRDGRVPLRQMGSAGLPVRFPDDQDVRMMGPTAQMIQRGLIGVDQMSPNWMPNGQGAPPQQPGSVLMPPPPGFGVHPNRNMQLVPGMFPPNMAHNVLSHNVLAQNMMAQNVLQPNVLPPNMLQQNVLAQNGMPQNVVAQNGYMVGPDGMMMSGGGHRPIYPHPAFMAQYQGIHGGPEPGPMPLDARQMPPQGAGGGDGAYRRS